MALRIFKAGILFFMGLWLMTCSAPQKVVPKPKLRPQPPKIISRFEVRILQDTAILLPVNGVIYLKKKPFEILVYVRNPMGLMVQTWLDETSLGPAQKGERLDNILGFSKTLLSGRQFNPKHHLQIAKDQADYWFYKDESEHCFNEVLVWPNGTLELVRSVHSVSFCGEGAKVVAKTVSGEWKLENVSLQKIRWLYLVFAEVADGEGLISEEKKRITVSLDFSVSNSQ